MTISPVNFSAIPVLNTPEKRENVKKYAVPPILTSTMVMVATRAKKGSEVPPLKMTTRLGRAGLAGAITLGAIALVNLNKEKVVQIVDKVKGVFKRNPAEKELDKTAPIQGDKLTAINPEDVNNINGKENATINEGQQEGLEESDQENKTPTSTTNENQVASSNNPFASPIDNEENTEGTSTNPFQSPVQTNDDTLMKDSALVQNPKASVLQSTQGLIDLNGANNQTNPFNAFKS